MNNFQKNEKKKEKKRKKFPFPTCQLNLMAKTPPENGMWAIFMLLDNWIQMSEQDH